MFCPGQHDKTPTPLLATIIGAIGGVIVVFSIVMMDKLKLDDPVGAISVHGTAGIWGLIAVVLSNPDANIGAQLYGIVAIFLWTFIVSIIFWLIIKMVIGLRISEEDEEIGADYSECGMEAYPEFVNK